MTEFHPNPRFIQIHTLHSYSGALLNRDDSGLAKRLPYGGTMRTRISSQCLKRHWRLADDPHALGRIEGATDAFRSRELVSLRVIEPLRAQFSEAVCSVLNKVFQTQVYGEKGPDKKSRQTLLFGAPELDWLAAEARKLAGDIAPILTAAGFASAPAEKAEKWAKNAAKCVEEETKAWTKSFKSNIAAMRAATSLPGGLIAALFGRMVTSDPEANIDAPIHVAHAFTTHEEEAEGDYFTAVDDLKRDEDDSGADTIGETELTSGLFYGYVVVDIAGLVENTTGIRRSADGFSNADPRLAAEVVHSLLYLITEVSPGAKLGSTAPYGRAAFLMVEVGDRQPRSLAAAFREASAPTVTDAHDALTQHLAALDVAYETGEARRAMHLHNEEIVSAPRGSLREIADWARSGILAGTSAGRTV